MTDVCLDAIDNKLMPPMQGRSLMLENVKRDSTSPKRPIDEEDDEAATSG